MELEKYAWSRVGLSYRTIICPWFGKETEKKPEIKKGTAPAKAKPMLNGKANPTKTQSKTKPVMNGKISSKTTPKSPTSEKTTAPSKKVTPPTKKTETVNKKSSPIKKTAEKSKSPPTKTK